MSTPLQIRLEQAENGLIFQILQQPEALRELGLNQFKASNGWVIEAMNHPAIEVTSKRIFLRGEHTEHDHMISLIITSSRQSYQEILVAFEEFVRSPTYLNLTDTVEQQQKRQFESNLISFDDGNLIIRLEKAENSLIFQLLAAPEELRGWPAHTITSPYLAVSSAAFPQLTASTLYLRGSDKEKDKTTTVCECTSNSTRDKLYNKVIDTIQILIESSEYQSTTCDHQFNSIHTFY